MRQIVLALVILILVGCNTNQSKRGTWELFDIPAPSLENSLVESDPDKTIGVYLPPSYAVEKDKHYPVVYFLEGYGGGVYDKGYTCWLLDTLIREKKVPEMIFVNISGRYTFHGSFYENSSVTGNWEDFVVSDVISYVDQNYRTLAKPESRAITGHSMGGYGALNLGMLHPEVFKVVYGMSPGLFNEQGLADCQMFKSGGTVQPVLDLIQKLEPLNKKEAHEAYMDYVKNIEDWNIEFTLAYGMTFAPNRDKAPYFDYPLILNGPDTIREESAWRRWESGFGNVEAEIQQYKSNLEQLNYLGLDCGHKDEFKWIPEGTQFYSDVLTQYEIQHHVNWHDGTHGSRFNESVQQGLFPEVAKNLQFE